MRLVQRVWCFHIGINCVSYDLQTPTDRKHQKNDYVYLFILTTYTCPN